MTGFLGVTSEWGGLFCCNIYMKIASIEASFGTTSIFHISPGQSDHSESPWARHKTTASNLFVDGRIKAEDILDLAQRLEHGDSTVDSGIFGLGVF